MLRLTKIGIHCRKKSASWLLVGLHCWILRRTQCTMICRSGDGSTTAQLAGFWDDLVKSRQHHPQVDLSSISSLPLPLDNCVCGKLVIVFNPNRFFWEWRKRNLSVASLGIATQNNRICPLMRIELLLKDRQPQNLHFLNSIEGRMDYNSFYMKGVTINPQAE